MPLKLPSVAALSHNARPLEGGPAGGTLAPSKCSTGARARLGPTFLKQNALTYLQLQGPQAMSLKGPYGLETFEASRRL